MKKPISRSKVELFMECPCCAYRAIKLNIPRPPGLPFTLNNATDCLLKSEMDQYREQQLPHPLATSSGIDLVPFKHADIDIWRSNFKGIRTQYKGVEFSGAVDDVWTSRSRELFVVDYKATAKAEPVCEIGDAAHHQIYKRQVEFYQWLLYKNGFSVSPTSYFVYATGDNTRSTFENTLLFTTKLIPYEGNFEWVEPTLDKLIACISSNMLPASSPSCKYCQWAVKIQAGDIRLIAETSFSAIKKN